MAEYLLLRLEGPLQAWGDVAMDSYRPVRKFPSLSALTGLLASALGWRYSDAARTNALQDALRLAVRIDRLGHYLVDYQTADLTRDVSGWTRWGIEKRDITNVLRLERVRGKADRKVATQQIWKSYLVDASFLVAIGIHTASPVSLHELEAAVRLPSRPLFLGRRSCPPALPLFESRVEAVSPCAALILDSPAGAEHWYDADDEPDRAWSESVEVWDRRDYESGQFIGARVLRRAADTGRGVS